MKKSEIKELADKFMKSNNVDGVFATSDGQLFTSKNYANLHATSNPKKKLEVFTFTNFDQPADSNSNSTEENKPKHAKDLVKEIADIETAEELDAIEKAEKELETPRKTVLDALASKRAALAEDGGQSTDNQRKNDDK